MLTFTKDIDNSVFKALGILELNKIITKNYILHNKVRMYIKFTKRSTNDFIFLKDLVIRRPEIQELILYTSKVTYGFLYNVRQMIKNCFVRILIVSPQPIAPNKLIKINNIRCYIDKELIFAKYILTL